MIYDKYQQIHIYTHTRAHTHTWHTRDTQVTHRWHTWHKHDTHTHTKVKLLKEAHQRYRWNTCYSPTHFKRLRAHHPQCIAELNKTEHNRPTCHTMDQSQCMSVYIYMYMYAVYEGTCACICICIVYIYCTVYVCISLSLSVYTHSHAHIFLHNYTYIQYTVVLQNTAQLYYIVFLCPWRLRSLADLDVKVAQLRSCTGVRGCVWDTQIQETWGKTM